MRLTDHPAWCALGGAALGGLAALGLALSGSLPSSGRGVAAPAHARGQGASIADAFLAAWRAHLMASWSVDEVERRTTTSGVTITFDVHEAQAPPDSLRIGNGTVAARRGDVQLACGPGTGGHPYACRSARAPLTWQQDVDRQIAALRAEVDGPAAFYDVQEAGAGCWSLALTKPGALVPVVAGRGATFCLDLATGVLRSSEVQRVGAVDRVTVVNVHAPAGSADLALPPAVRALTAGRAGEAASA